MEIGRNAFLVGKSTRLRRSGGGRRLVVGGELRETGSHLFNLSIDILLPLDKVVDLVASYGTKEDNPGMKPLLLGRVNNSCIDEAE